MKSGMRGGVQCRLVRVGFALLIGMTFCSVVSAQDLASDAPPFPDPGKTSGASSNKPIIRIHKLANSPERTVSRTARVITLEEALEQAAGAENPLARLGALQVEAAKQNRKTFEASYFPQISSTFANLHFNKFMGEQIAVRRPVLGGISTIGIPLLNKDETMAVFNVMQPLTPLLKVKQAVKIARADENIARVKAGMPVAETAAKVEKSYFALLIAQRELTVAQVQSKRVQDKYLLASTSPASVLSAEQEAELISAEKKMIMANSQVRELSASLNSLIGLPEETELELVPPSPQVEAISLADATQTAMASNPEVVEAEQTAIKARAGRRLAKLDYVPDVAVLGGYAYQTVMPLLPRDFSYVGVMATFTIFDGGKREHTVKMRNAQVEAAELAVVLTKAKVAASVKTSYLEMDRSRLLSQVSQRMISTSQVVNADYHANAPEGREVRAGLEAEMFRAELAYREALARLKSLMGSR